MPSEMEKDPPKYSHNFIGDTNHGTEYFAPLEGHLFENSPSKRDSISASNGVDYTLHVAFQELKYHLRQSQEEISHLKRCRSELMAELESQKVNVAYLQKEVYRKEKEKREIQQKYGSLLKENSSLKQCLSRQYSAKAVQHGKPLFPTYPWSRSTGHTESADKNFSGSDWKLNPLLSPPANFKYSVDLGVHSASSSESWEEISQKLFYQMQQEMKELKELGQRLATESPDMNCIIVSKDGSQVCKESGSVKDAEVSEENCNIVNSMKSQLGDIKSKLIAQKLSLSSLAAVLLSSSKDVPGSLKSSYLSVNKLTEQESNLDNKMDVGAPQQNPANNNLKFSRPSDESFRVYFTQQLSGCLNKPESHSPSAERKEMQQSKESPWNSAKQEYRCRSSSSRLIPNQRQFFSQHHNNLKQESPEERICPVCEALFPADYPQKEFEDHVMEHFSGEQPDILDQYEVL